MKNIHILPTDKPSRFSLNSSGKYYLTNQLYTNSPNFTNQNIYITNDEEIKEGDWYLTNKNTLCKCIKIDNKYVYSLEGGSSTNCKKIILTTDQDLIKDGVQAIDDEFLEWFVKNPTCEEVEVEIESKFDRVDGHYHDVWEITIPKEEPKQETTADYIDRHVVEAMVEVAKQKMYSEEEVKEIINQYKEYFSIYRNTQILNAEIEEWFEQFKK